MTTTIDAAIPATTLLDWIDDGGELALIDIREEGLFGEEHLLLAVNIPFSRLDIDIAARVPRPSTRIVLVAETSLAPLARRRLEALGYGSVHWLKDGNAGWGAAGQPLFKGVNVPSKAFAECVEHAFHTPDIEAVELDRLLREKADLVILDTRTREEFERFHVPGAINAPGSEVVRRFAELVPSDDTFVVVSCAGRTRGIIGAQALIDAGVPNRVAALSGGTQGWRLAGLELERGVAAPPASPVSEAARERAIARSLRLAQRFDVPEIDRSELARLRGEGGRTTYLFDVRTPEEYAASHAAGFVSAPGGQLVQALDGWVATRGARIVLTDDDGVRARVTGRWLRQLGWDVRVLPGLVDGDAPPSAHARPGAAPGARRLSAEEVRHWLADGAVLLSADPSADYRASRPVGAEWVNRSRLERLDTQLASARKVIVTAGGLPVATLVANDLAERTGASVAVYPGGRAYWEAAGLSVSPSPHSPSDSERVDFLFWVHDRHSGNAASSRAYLDWELGLPAAVSADGRSGFRIEPPRSG